MVFNFAGEAECNFGYCSILDDDGVVGGNCFKIVWVIVEHPVVWVTSFRVGSAYGSSMVG